MTRKKPAPTPEPAEEPRSVAYTCGVSVTGNLTLADLLELTYEAVRREFPDESVVSGYFTHASNGYLSILPPAERREFT